MPKLLGILVLFLALPAGVWAQAYDELPAFPGGARDDAIAELIEGHMYYGTGYDATFSPRKDFWRYSIKERAWQQLADAPFSPRQYCVSAAVGHHLFVLAGWSGPQRFHKEVWRFDTRALVWKEMNSFPGKARWAAVAAENADLVYFGLGQDTAQKFKDWWRYHPETDLWQQLPDFPGAARSVAFAEVVDNKIYVGLGEDSLRKALSDIWAFDISGKEWAEMSIDDMPALKHPATAVEKGKIYIAGGEGEQELTTDLLELNPARAALKSFGSPGFRQARGSNMLSDGCRLYLIGGLSVGFQRLEDFGTIEWPPFEKAVPEVFPNPAHSLVDILHPEEAERIEVLDGTGSLVMKIPASCDQTRIQMNRLGSGVYFVRWCGAECSQVAKLLILDP